MVEPTRVLFVCLGNICRSPLAEGILQDRVNKMGVQKRLEIDSAGTAAYHVGERPDKRVIGVAREAGINITGLRGRQIKKADLDYFDYILAMDRTNYQDIQTLMGGQNHHAQLDLLLSFHPGIDHADVPDPYYGGEDGFIAIFDQIEVACQGFLDDLNHAKGA